MLDQNIQNKAVFVGRYYGGVDLGSTQFKIIKQVADDALVELSKHEKEVIGSLTRGNVPTKLMLSPAGPCK